MVKKCGLSKSKFQLFIYRWKVWQLRNSKKYMAENTAFGILIKAMINEFKQEAEEGVVVDIETIKTKLKKVLSLDKSFDIDLLDLDNRNDKTLKILRFFFEVEGTQVKRNGKKVYLYRLGTLTFDSNNSYIGKVTVPFDTMAEHSEILTSTEINRFGYPSFWD